MVDLIANAAMIAEPGGGALPQRESVALDAAVFGVAMTAGVTDFSECAAFKSRLAALHASVGFGADAAMVAEHRESSRHRYS